MSCSQVRAWLDRETESLDEGDRLVVEVHLQSCEACRVERAQFALARRVVGSLPHESIGPRGHARAIARALIAAPGNPLPTHTSAIRWWTVAVPALAIGAVAVVLAVRSTGAEDATPSPTYATPAPLKRPKAPERPAEQTHAPRDVQPQPQPQREASLVDGSLVDGSSTLRAGDDLPADVVLRAPARAGITVLDTRIVIAASSSVRWARIDRALLLDTGQVEVDTAKGASLRVVVHRFAVEVSGSATVKTRAVRVVRGTARVVAPDGKVLALVKAGDSWTIPEARTVPVTVPGASVHIDRARASYAAGNHASAEQHANAALQASPTRKQEAEARTIFADCARGAGRLDDAVTLYEAIATRFAELPAGETALFAAARLEAIRGRADAARVLVARYLARYPAGRFVEDARLLRKPR